jgi:hypothetical protein
MKRSKDPLTAACTSFLTPWAKSKGFKKVTNRMYARDSGDTIQKLAADANGFGGKKSTLFTLSSHLVYEEILGYWERAGFRLCGDGRWDMSTHELADKSMQDVINVLEQSELEKIDEISSVDGYLNLYARYLPDHFQTARRKYDNWRAGDKTLLEIAADNRAKLKLA